MGLAVVTVLQELGVAASGTPGCWTPGDSSEKGRAVEKGQRSRDFCRRSVGLLSPEPATQEGAGGSLGLTLVPRGWDGGADTVGGHPRGAV